MNTPPNTQYCQNIEIIFSKVDGDLILLDIRKGKYFFINKIGSVIWEKLATPQTFESLVDQLLNEYNIDRTTCEQETAAFIESVLNLGFLETQQLSSE